MASFFEDEDGEYMVLINAEGQYSLWRPTRDIPDGWTAVGPRGARQECLDYVERHWTDMRPNSLIEFMKAGEVEEADVPPARTH